MTSLMAGGGAQVDTRNVDVNLQANTDAYVTGMNQAAVATNQTASAVDALDQKVRSAGRTIQSGLMKFSRDDFVGLGIASADAATFDKQLGTLNATAAVTNRNFAGVKGAIEKTFTSVPESRTNLIALAETINQLGVTAPRDIGQLLATFTKLGEATGEGPQQLAQGLIQLSRLMGQTDASKITGFANGLLTVSKNAGVSASGVLGFAQAIAPLARQAGITESAVLGISAAFSKAGADGYQAANTFNSIIGDITNLVQTGSPEIAKYATFIGLTVEQFRKLPRKEQILDIFQAIGKGGPQAVGFVNQLGLGTRAISAVQAVAQSGGLRQAIDVADANSTGSKNLDKGADAATNNLADGLAKVRNELTQIGTEIGETFQGPLKIAVNLLGGMLHLLNMIVKPLSPIIAGFGAMAGAVAGVAGAAGGLGGLVLAGGAANLLLRSGPSRALRDGLRDGRGIVGETDLEKEQRLAGSRSAVLYRDGKLGRATRFYESGTALGGLRGPVDPAVAAAERGGPGVVRQAARYAVRAPGLMIGASARSSAKLYRDMGVADYDRSAYKSTAAAAEGEVVARKGVIRSLTDWVKGQAAANKASVESEGTTKAFARTMAQATKETAEYGVQIARTGASLAMTGGKSTLLAGGGAGPAAAVEGGASRFAGIRGAIGAGASMLGRVAFNPYVLLAAMFGPGIYSSLKGLSGPAAKVNDDEGSFMNPVKQLNDALGITTDKLASFSSAVGDATKAAAGSPGATTSLADATRVTPADLARVRGNDKFKSDPTLATLGGSYGSSQGDYYGTAPIRNVQNAEALLAQYDLKDPRQVASARDNLLAAGYSPADTMRILGNITSSGRDASGDYRALGTAVTLANDLPKTDNSPRASNQSTESKRLSDAALTGIANRYTTNLATHSASYASATEIRNVSDLLKFQVQSATQQTGGGDSNVDIATIARTLATVTGGKASDYYTSDGHAYQLKTKATGDQAIVDLLGKTAAGRQILTSAGIKPGAKVDSQTINGILARTQAQASSQVPTVLTGTALGRAVGGVGSFQSAAFGTAQGDPATIQKAVEETTQTALKMTGSYTTAAASLQKLADATGGAAGTVLSASADFARQLQGFQTQTQSRSGQIATGAANLAADRAAAQPNAQGVVSQAAVDRYKGDQLSFAQQEEGQRQYLIQLGQQAKAYRVQQERGQEDYDKSVERSERDFRISSLNSQEDFNRQMERNQRDHNRQLSQSNAVQAQTIYDPYGRVQAKFTVDAGTLDQNLGDQNQRLARQKKAIDQLKKMGLSMEAIQTLNLASPDLSQQVDALLADAQADPSVIGRLNADTATRVKLTKNLTQSDYNLTFQQGEQNYQQSIKDADKDYAIQRQRAVDAQRRSLHDMATDYNEMVNRSGQDLVTSMTEIYGSYATVYERTLKQINGDIGKYVPSLASSLATQVKSATSSIYAAAGQTTLGQIGRTAQGIGSYDAKGHFTPATIAQIGALGVSDSSALPYLYNPVTGHATGTISTKEHIAKVSEGGRPEMILPLDARGQQFMATMYQGITSHLVNTLRAGSYASSPTGPSSSSQYVHMDSSTTYSGDIHVQATNVNDFEQELAAKRRLSRLSRPKGAAVG